MPAGTGRARSIRPPASIPSQRVCECNFKTVTAAGWCCGSSLDLRSEAELAIWWQPVAQRPYLHGSPLLQVCAAVGSHAPNEDLDLLRAQGPIAFQRRLPRPAGELQPQDESETSLTNICLCHAVRNASAQALCAVELDPVASKGSTQVRYNWFRVTCFAGATGAKECGKNRTGCGAGRCAVYSGSGGANHSPHMTIATDAPPPPAPVTPTPNAMAVPGGLPAPPFIVNVSRVSQ